MRSFVYTGFATQSASLSFSGGAILLNITRSQPRMDIVSVCSEFLTELIRPGKVLSRVGWWRRTVHQYPPSWSLVQSTATQTPKTSFLRHRQNVMPNYSFIPTGREPLGRRFFFNTDSSARLPIGSLTCRIRVSPSFWRMQGSTSGWEIWGAILIPGEQTCLCSVLW